LFLVHPDGSGTKTITPLAGGCCAVWSPGGDRLVFTRGSSDQVLDLWTVMVDGSHLTQLTHTPANLTDIGWSAP
jgi:Tol biopolymer transport system component